jgi:hypothetical protein
MKQAANSASFLSALFLHPEDRSDMIMWKRRTTLKEPHSGTSHYMKLFITSAVKPQILHVVSVIKCSLHSIVERMDGEKVED